MPATRVVREFLTLWKNFFMRGGNYTLSAGGRQCEKARKTSARIRRSQGDRPTGATKMAVLHTAATGGKPVVPVSCQDGGSPYSRNGRDARFSEPPRWRLPIRLTGFEREGLVGYGKI